MRQTDQNGWMAIDYMLQGFYKNTLLKYQQLANAQTMRQFWHLVKPSTLMMEVNNRQIHINGNSMLLFLIAAFRTMQEIQPDKMEITWPGENKRELITGVFNMDDAEKLASLIPDEILPPYRKNRSYINSILASNEISRYMEPGCKQVFARVQRGRYIMNPEIKWQSSQ